MRPRALSDRTAKGVTSLPVPLVVEIAIRRARMDLFRRILDHALADIHEGRRQFFQVRIGRFILQLHDFGGIDDRSAAQRDDLIRLVEIQRLHALAR